MRTQKNILDKEDDHNTDRWLVSYADFITLMFAFFVVLYATSDLNLEKTKKLQESIKKQFPTLRSSGPLGDSDHSNGTHPSADSVVSPYVKGSSSISSPIKNSPSAQEKTNQEILEQTEKAMEEKILNGKGKELIQDITSTDTGIRVSLNGALLFAAHSIKFRNESLGPLNDFCHYLASMKKKLVIEAHTRSGMTHDSSFASEWEFAAARASSFVRYLIRGFQYPPEKLVSVSYGSHHPLFPETDHKNSPKNERLDVLILTTEDYY